MYSSAKPFARLTAEQWQQIIDQQTISGQSQKRFCQSRSISLSSFTTWKRKLSQRTPSATEEPEPPSSDSWLEIPAHPQTVPADTPWHMELELPGGVILRMRR